MGSTLSCIHGSSGSGQSQQPAATPEPEPAMVIAPDGSLKELPASNPPVSVSDILGSGDANAAPFSGFFVCNSDALYFNEPPPVLAADERLRPGQMYFVLPADMLGRPLSSADMATLAVRASSALGPVDKPQRRGRGAGKKSKQQVRVVPITRVEGRDNCDDEQGVFHETLNELTLGGSAAVFSSTPARRAEEAAAVASRKTRTSAFTRMLSMIREDAE